MSAAHRILYDLQERRFFLSRGRITTGARHESMEQVRCIVFWRGRNSVHEMRRSRLRRRAALAISANVTLAASPSLCRLGGIGAHRLIERGITEQETMACRRPFT